MKLCLKPIQTRSREERVIVRCCYKEEGHIGSCEEFPYLSHLNVVAPRVANKIKRDATKTTGAAWKSEDAGPNRIDRWAMLLNEEELLKKYKVNLSVLKPSVQAKLREKAATYEDCMNVAAKLTFLVYQMKDAPTPPDLIHSYLENHFGLMSFGSTKCIICKDYLSFALFDEAKRGRAHIETAHANPRIHNPENVGFAHRECNIAQGNRTLDEFYEWMYKILQRVEWKL